MTNLILYEAPRDQLESMMQLLDSKCNREQLKNFAMALAPWLNTFDKVKKCTTTGVITDTVLVASFNRTNCSKDALINGLSLVMADRRNLTAYVASLTDEMRYLWKCLLLDIIVSHDKAKEILNTTSDLFKRRDDGYSYYYSRNSEPDWHKRQLGWFTTEKYRSLERSKYGYRDYEDFIIIKRVVHNIFLPIFFQEAIERKEVPVQLDTDKYSIYDFEAESVVRYHLFSGLMEQGELPMKTTGNGGIGIADMKRAQKSMSLKEFFPEEMGYRYGLRSQSYIKLLAICENLRTRYRKKPTTYDEALRDLVERLDCFDKYLPAMLYPHIKGLRKQNTDYGRHVKLWRLMLECLKDDAISNEKAWTRIVELLPRICLLDADNNSSRFVTQVFHPDDEQYSTEIVNLQIDLMIGADSYVKQFGLGGLEALSFMLCSLGMVQLAVIPGRELGASPFDSAEYVRLTPLGRYVLGVTDKYEAPEHERVAYFELDPERLIIRSLVEPNPYAQLLLDTSKPISRNRYETSALSFLAHCHKRADVENKISIFRRFISSELPPLWERFFQSLLQHCHPLKEDRTGYKRYTIDPDNRELIELLTTDPVLRSLIIRAEGFLILLKSDNLPAFENQLKKHGYLL